jgi:hypothetical protein
MKVSKASKIWLDYHQINSKKKYTSEGSAILIVYLRCRFIGEIGTANFFHRIYDFQTFGMGDLFQISR